MENKTIYYPNKLTLALILTLLVLNIFVGLLIWHKIDLLEAQIKQCEEKQ